MSRLQNLDSSPIYYIDSNIFFYAKINDAKYGRSSGGILELISKAKVTAATSSLVLLEVSNSMVKYGLSKEVKQEIAAIISLPLRLEDLESTDASNATRLFEDHRISPYDCAHVAIMQRIGSTQIVSADKDFDRVQEIDRIDPLNSKSFIQSIT